MVSIGESETPEQARLAHNILYSGGNSFRDYTSLFSSLSLSASLTLLPIIQHSVLRFLSHLTEAGLKKLVFIGLFLVS